MSQNNQQRPTPETDAMFMAFNRREPNAIDPADFARKLERERDEARKQLERGRMRLVACDVVAMADTESSRGPTRDMHTNYWSAAVESVIRRVDECIELRRQNEAMQSAFMAAKAFIDSHVADPDITSEMMEKYADYQKALAKLQTFLKVKGILP